MLRVLLHSGHLTTRNPGNLMATLDIAYRKQEAWSDYTVAFSLKGTGTVETDEVNGYGRGLCQHFWPLGGRKLRGSWRRRHDWRGSRASHSLRN